MQQRHLHLVSAQAFWEERALRLRQGQALGHAVLLYGCHSRSSDLIYIKDMRVMEASGVLSNVITALSREKGVPKTYVQVDECEGQ